MAKYFVLLISIVLFTFPTFSSVPQKSSPEQLQALQRYIKQSWQTLKRSNAQLAQAAPDPKFKPMSDGRWPVYVSQRENIKQIEQSLRSQMPAEEFAKIELRQLPNDASQIREHGLLYLPYPYVVPGGRFNEMYGWDSYFIQLGLLRDGQTARAKDMVDNFIYEIDR